MSENKGGLKKNERDSMKRLKIDEKLAGMKNIKKSHEIVQLFETYATELDEKNNRFEKIAKISRDITLESKRIILFLHTINKNNEEDVLSEASARLRDVARNLFRSIAEEQKKQDSYQYRKAYRNGLEGYIEAITFYQYLRRDVMKSFLEMERLLTYRLTHNYEMDSIQIVISPYDYVLGIADATGELMRMCINKLEAGDTASYLETCEFIKEMYSHLVGCTNSPSKLLSRKLCTLEQNIQKIESIYYTIKIKGSEMLKNMLVDLVGQAHEENDENYYVY